MVPTVTETALVSVAGAPEAKRPVLIARADIDASEGRGRGAGCRPANGTCTVVVDVAGFTANAQSVKPLRERPLGIRPEARMTLVASWDGGRLTADGHA